MNWCDCIGTKHAVLFIEHEYRMHQGTEWKTGRVRVAVSHLVCMRCLKDHCVDGDYLAGPWRQDESNNTSRQNK